MCLATANLPKLQRIHAVIYMLGSLSKLTQLECPYRAVPVIAFSSSLQYEMFRWALYVWSRLGMWCKYFMTFNEGEKEMLTGLFEIFCQPTFIYLISFCSSVLLLKTVSAVINLNLETGHLHTFLTFIEKDSRSSCNCNQGNWLLKNMNMMFRICI